MERSEPYILNMGPQHPSTHGVLQVRLRLDGETILEAKPELGYLHRGIEKLMEQRSYVQCVPYTDRLDYVSAMNNNLGFCSAVEALAGLEVPERAGYLRIMAAELNRIASHLIFIGTLAIDLGAATGMIYTFRDREKILDIFDELCGARMSFHYIRIGGVSHDASSGALRQIEAFLDYVPQMLQEYEELLGGNEIFRHRLQGTSVLSPQDALAFGLTGPNARASGLDYDIRKLDGYGLYDRFEFAVPLGQKGDNWDRYRVRFEEIQQSAGIVRQALEALPQGPVMGKVPRVLRPPAGEVYHRVENPRGELGFYLVSDGSAKPYRVHIRRPSFVNLQALDAMCRGMQLADSVAAFSTIDPLMGEVDC